MIIGLIQQLYNQFLFNKSLDTGSFFYTVNSSYSGYTTGGEVNVGFQYKYVLFYYTANSEPCICAYYNGTKMHANYSGGAWNSYTLTCYPSEGKFTTTCSGYYVVFDWFSLRTLIWDVRNS